MPRRKVYLEPRVATAVRLPISLHSQLKQAADARRVSVNALVIGAITDYVSKQRIIEPTGSQ